MRTFFCLFLVALILGVAAALFLGIVGVTAEHHEGSYIVTFTIHTDMIPITTTTNSANAGTAEVGQLVDLKGKITALRPEKNELAVSENLKNWTFALAKDSKIFVNDAVGKLSDLQVGDLATVSFTRRGEQLVANVVHTTRP